MVQVVGRAARHGFRPLALPFWDEVPHVIVTAFNPAVPSPNLKATYVQFFLLQIAGIRFARLETTKIMCTPRLMVTR
jgi:hypothetical protein